MKFQSSLYLRIVAQICLKILPMLPPYEEILIASEIKYLNVLSSALSIQIWTLSSPSKSVGAQQRSGNIQRSWSWVLCHILGPCSWLPIIWTFKSSSFLLNSWCKYMNMLLMWIIDSIKCEFWVWFDYYRNKVTNRGENIFKTILSNCVILAIQEQMYSIS